MFVTVIIQTMRFSNAYIIPYVLLYISIKCILARVPLSIIVNINKYLSFLLVWSLEYMVVCKDAKMFMYIYINKFYLCNVLYLDKQPCIVNMFTFYTKYIILCYF